MVTYHPGVTLESLGKMKNLNCIVSDSAEIRTAHPLVKMLK